MLLRALVAHVVLNHLLVAVVRRLVLRARGDGVPGDASFGDVVEPVEHARDMEGMVIGRRHRDAEADALRHPRHARDHRHHVVARPFGAPAHRRVVVAAIVLRRAARVPEEQHVHDSARGHAGDVFIEFGAAVIGIAFPRARHLPQVVGVIVREIGGEMDQLRLRHDARAPYIAKKFSTGALRDSRPTSTNISICRCASRRSVSVKVNSMRG
jgi:hypothetical protein